MENSTNLKKKISLFEKLARLFFVIYMITLYVFVDKLETVAISRGVFVLYAGFSGLTLLQRKRIHIGKNIMVAYLAITWMYATTFWAYNDFWASYKMNTVWQVFLLFFLTYNLFVEDEEAHEYLLKSLYIAGVSLLGYSIYTYGISGVIEMMTSPGGVRLGREISHENTFGMYNATTVIVAFYYIIHKKSYKLINVAIFATAFLFAMSSGSRKALLMMCAGILFLVYSKYGLKKLYKVVLIVATLVLLFMMIIKLPMFDLINNRMETLVGTIEGDGTGDASANNRFKMISDGWRIFKDRILIGYGANNYALVSGYGTYSHNNFIEVLVDFGLIGFVLYYLSYIFAMSNLIRAKQDAAKALLAIFLVRLIMEVALVSYYEKMQWILLAIFLVNCKKENTPNDEITEEETSKYKNEEICEMIEGDCYEEVEDDIEETVESYEEPGTCSACPVEQ